MTNQRYLVSRNKREGWYAGLAFKQVGKNKYKNFHMRNKEWGLRFGYVSWEEYLERTAS